MYVPGMATSPSGDAGVSPGFALISKLWENAGGASCRRSQFVRLEPAIAGSGTGVVTQKFGCGGRAASGTGMMGAFDRWRTRLPRASSTSIDSSRAGCASQ